jgi:hypothetical protein
MKMSNLFLGLAEYSVIRVPGSGWRGLTIKYSGDAV